MIWKILFQQDYLSPEWKELYNPQYPHRYNENTDRSCRLQSLAVLREWQDRYPRARFQSVPR